MNRAGLLNAALALVAGAFGLPLLVRGAWSVAGLDQPSEDAMRFVLTVGVGLGVWGSFLAAVLTEDGP